MKSFGELGQGKREKARGNPPKDHHYGNSLRLMLLISRAIDDNKSWLPSSLKIVKLIVSIAITEMKHDMAC